MVIALHLRLREQWLRYGNQFCPCECQPEFLSTLRVHPRHMGRWHGRSSCAWSLTIRSRLVCLRKRSDDHGDGHLSLFRSLDVRSRHQVRIILEQPVMICCFQLPYPWRNSGCPQEPWSDHLLPRETDSSQISDRWRIQSMSRICSFFLFLPVLVIVVPMSCALFDVGDRQRREEGHRRRREPCPERSRITCGWTVFSCVFERTCWL